MDETQAALLAEQMKHALDLMRSDLDALRAQQAHNQKLTDHRLELAEKDLLDHEARLRSNTDGVTQFKLWSGTSGLLALAALVRSFFSLS